MRELRVHGPPGTGKTTHLKGRVEATARERGTHAIRIASLTRAAAHEIGARVALPHDQVGTLHRHAFHALERPALADTKEGIREWNTYAERIAQALVMETGSRDATIDDPGGEALIAVGKTEGDRLLSQYKVLRNRCVPRDAWPMRVRDFAEHWEKFKAKAKRIDFTDLIDRATDELPTMPGNPSVFLLDEAQDMSRLEMRLARQWGEHCDVFVIVGDPYQNLYQWRGSDPEVFDDHGDAEVSVLEQSWRVPAAVHEHAVAWLNRTLRGGLKVPYRPRDFDGNVRGMGETYRAPEGLAVQLETDLAEGRRVMVLAATGYMLDPLIAVLRRRGVPFGNPYRVEHGGWNPLNGATRLRAFLRPRLDGVPWTWSDVRLWADPLKASAVFERGAKGFIEAKCTSTKLFGGDDPGEHTADVEALFNLVREEHRDDLFDLDVEWFARHLLESRAGQLAYSLNVYRNFGPSALHSIPKAVGPTDGEWPGIVLGTIHSVKGGEADRVYVFPDLSNAGFDGWLAPGWQHDAIARQFYVAFTRAREELVLCDPSGAFAVHFNE